jgi:hypothetical protein
VWKWEALTPDEILHSPTLENIYAILQQRLAQRPPNGALPEGVPITKEQVDTVCDRRGRIGRIKFTPRDVMGTAASGSREHFRVTYNRGYAEFWITGKYTTSLLTPIFKARVPDWQLILAARASRDVMNVIEIGTLTEWEPEQDLSQDDREINTPSRFVEERGRCTIIRKDRDFLRLLDHQAAMQREIRVGIGLREDGRVTDMWFMVQRTPAQSIEEYGAHIMRHLMAGLQALSPEWAWPLFRSAPQEYHIRVTVRNDEVALWYLSQIWVEDDSTPAAHQPVTKEWIVYPGVDCFITPVAGVNEGLAAAERIFGNGVVGERVQNPENPAGYITRVTDGNMDIPMVWLTQAQWHRPREVQEQVNRRIAEISSTAEPLNAKTADFLADFNKEEGWPSRLA